MRNEGFRLEWATSIAEIYRDGDRFAELACHYNSLGQTELRDKFIEEALKHNPSDHDICHLRGLQGRPDLIPAEVLERELKSLADHRDTVDRGFLYVSLNRYQEAALDWVTAVKEDLEQQNNFAAAYYLKLLSGRGVVDQLFLLALNRARENKDLWWQVRAMEELGWDHELCELLLANAESIDESDNLQLKQKLARARGDDRRVMDLSKEIASVGVLKSYGSPKRRIENKT